MILAGDIRLEPAQDHRVVTPLATVVSASMPLHRVIDRGNPDNAVYAPLNGGMRAPMRLGLRSEAVLEHIRWLNTEFADLLATGLNQPVPVMPIAAQALREGDDCHGRTPAGTRLMMAELERGLGDYPIDDNLRDFMDNSPPLFLNLWMAASKCLMLAAAGVKGSSFVIAAAGNGVDSGIQVSGLPGQWFRAPATPPRGRLDESMLPAERALPAIGDSARWSKCSGLGAMALQLSPEQEKNFRRFPARRLPRASHPVVVWPSIAGFEGLELPAGIDAHAPRRSYGRGPIIGLGILDITGEKGPSRWRYLRRADRAIFDAAVAVLEVLDRIARVDTAESTRSSLKWHAVFVTASANVGSHHVQACIDRIEAREAEIGAFVCYDAEAALDAARRSGSDRTARAALHGVPIRRSRILSIPITSRPAWGTSFYAGSSARSATPAASSILSRPVAILFGKTVTTEFAYFKPGKTANPRNPGPYAWRGSSSGSAARRCRWHVAVRFRLANRGIPDSTGGLLRYPGLQGESWQLRSARRHGACRPAWTRSAFSRAKSKTSNWRARYSAAARLRRRSRSRRKRRYGYRYCGVRTGRTMVRSKCAMPVSAR